MDYLDAVPIGFMMKGLTDASFPKKFSRSRRKNCSLIPREIYFSAKTDTIFLSNRFIHFITKEFCRKMKHLKQLFISLNKIQFIPDEFVNLQNLELVCFSGNQIEDFTILTLLPNLKHLEIGFNKIRVIPDSIINLNKLESLELHGNLITTLPRNIYTFQNLDYLDLQRNDIKKIDKKIKNLKSLRILSIDRTLITSLPKQSYKLKKLRNINTNSYTRQQLSLLMKNNKKNTYCKKDYSYFI